MPVQTTEKFDETIRLSHAAEETLGGAETILFVEDEAFVRDVTCEVLQSAGYRVLTAKNAAEAMRLYEQNSGEVELLLSDVVLPGRDWVVVGVQAAARESAPQGFIGYRICGADGTARGEAGGVSGEAFFHGDLAAESAATAGSRDLRIRTEELVRHVGDSA